MCYTWTQGWTTGCAPCLRAIKFTFCESSLCQINQDCVVLGVVVFSQLYALALINTQQQKDMKLNGTTVYE